MVKNLPASAEDAGLIPGSRRKWQSPAVFLPEISHRQRSLVGYRPWDHRESDTTVTKVTTNSSITVMKKFEILQELPKCNTETLSEEMLLEK